MYESIINQFFSDEYDLTDEQRLFRLRIIDPPLSWEENLYTDERLDSTIALEVPANNLFSEYLRTSYRIVINCTFTGKNLKHKEDTIDNVMDDLLIRYIDVIPHVHTTCNLSLINLENVKDIILTMLWNGWGTDGMYEIETDGKDSD